MQITGVALIILLFILLWNYRLKREMEKRIETEKRLFKANQDLKEDRPEQEMRRGLHIQPDVAVCQDALVVPEANKLRLAVQAVSAVVREAQPDRPD